MLKYRIYKKKRNKSLHNPVAKELGTDKFQPKVVHPRKIYDRNKMKREKYEGYVQDDAD